MSLQREYPKLTLIYGPFKNGGRFNGSEIMAIFNQDGLVEETVLEEEFLQLFNHEPKAIGEGTIAPFDSLEDIQKFGFNICQKLRNSGVSLVSLDDYNTLISESHKIEDLKQKLEEKGNFLKNPDVEKSGFFNKIFN